MRKPRLLLLAAGTLGAIVIAGCCHSGPSTRLPPPPPTPGPRTLALLPLDNRTVSVDGPLILRSHFPKPFGARGWVIQPPGETDERLRGIGVTLGGQVPGIKLEELRKALGTEAALGGTLLTHSNLVLGVSNQQTLEAELILIDLTNGHVLWRGRRKLVESQDHGVRGNGAAAAIGLLAGVASGVAKNNMQQISDHLAWTFARAMPWAGPGYDVMPPVPPPPPPGASTPATNAAPTPPPGQAAVIPGAPTPTPTPAAPVPDGLDTWPR